MTNDELAALYLKAMSPLAGISPWKFRQCEEKSSLIRKCPVNISERLGQKGGLRGLGLRDVKLIMRILNNGEVAVEAINNELVTPKLSAQKEMRRTGRVIHKQIRDENAMEDNQKRALEDIE